MLGGLRTECGLVLPPVEAVQFGFRIPHPLFAAAYAGNDGAVFIGSSSIVQPFHQRIKATHTADSIPTP